MPKVLAPTNANPEKRKASKPTEAEPTAKKKAAASEELWKAHRATCGTAGEVDAQLATLEGKVEPYSDPWPARSLIFKCWRGLGVRPEGVTEEQAMAMKDERDSLLMDVLVERGWTDGGNPCSKDDMKELPLIIAGKHPTDKLPRRAFYVCGDDAEARVLHGLPGTGSQYRVSGFPGAEPACYKTSVAKCLGGMPFVPETYVLPNEADALAAAAARDRKLMQPSFWLGKPRNEYAGRGIQVFSGNSKQFESAASTNKLGVVQRYLERPLLIGGYKFHMRIYLLVTECEPEPRAYVHNDAHVMFCTMPYVGCTPDTIGEHFEPRRHLSNYDINCTPQNMDNYLAPKGGEGVGVGSGCCWGMRRLEKWLQTHRKDVRIADVWHQIHVICHHITRAIATYPTIRKYRPTPLRCSELYGLDLMLDDSAKVWLLEYNNSPGLEYCGSHFPDGTANPDSEENDLVTKGICHDRFALLGMDREACSLGNAANFRRVH